MFARTVELDLRCSPEEAFNHVAREFFTNHPRWDPDIVELTMLSDGPIGVGTEGREVRQVGPGRFVTGFRVAEFEPNSAFAHRSIEGAMGEDVHYSFRSTQQGTHLTMNLRIVPRTLPMRILAPVINIGVRRNFERNVGRFERMLRELPTARTA
jgi:hypothetical protein